MNEQINKDRELLAKWHFGKNLMGRIVSMSAEDVDALLAAQKRVAQQEEKQKIAKLVTGFITDRMGDILYTDLQELERLILTDND